MNNKKLIFSVLILFVILSIGCVSAAPDDNTTSTEDAQVLSTDTNQTVVSDTSNVTITNDMDNSAIQEAIDGADEGSTINFENGTYSDINLVVNKTLTLNGNGATLQGTPNAGNRWNGIFTVMNCNNTKVTGFNFVCIGVNGTIQMNTPSTLIVYNTTNTTIENNTVTGGRFGIAITSNFSAPNYYAVVRNNTVYDTLDAGIQSFGSAYTLIANNTIIDSGNHGIDVRHGTGPNCTVVNNTVIGGKEGIYIMHSSNHTVENNTVINTTISGITAYGAANTVFDYNTINGSRIGYLLASGYSNITIGSNNQYNLDFIPMTPTFTYEIVTSDSTLPSSGTFTDTSYTATGTNIQADNVTKEYLSTENNTFIAKLWHNSINYPIPDQELTVTIDNETYTEVTDDSGAVYIDITNLTAGKHIVTVSYNGTRYNASNWTGYINVIDLEGYTIDVKVNNTGKPKAIITLMQNGQPVSNANVTFKIAGRSITRTTNASGQTFLSIILDSGNYTVTGVYTNANNNTITASEVAEIKSNYTITVNNISMTYKDGSKSIITLKNWGVAVGNKKVTFKIAGRSITRTTNASGQTYLTITLKPGTYTMNAVFNENGNNISSTGTVKINKGTVKYSSVTRTVKNGQKFSIKVLDSKNKAVTGQKVRIYINGKNHYVTTNSKGIAYLKIVLKPKNYKVTYSLTSNALYSNGLTKKSSTLTVRG